MSPTLSPLNPGNENESDKASDSGFSNDIETPAAAAAAAAATVGGLDISRLCFECRWQNCGKVFRRPSDLTKHERYHIKEYLCDETGCDKAFATMKDLKRHKKTHETLDGDSSGYRCRVPGCRKAKTGHVYNRRDNFVRHLRTKHVGMDFDVREEYDMTY
ncbi:Zinc finger protein GLIS3 [Colletotrichum higginsianum]|nr:Zinc finger protein GLIS3 [Colletotrichum higginsianum]